MSAASQKISKVRDMCEAMKVFATDENLDHVEQIGGLREATVLSDTHAGLPIPQYGDWVFFGTVLGLRQKFLLRGDRIIYNRPN